MKTALLALSLGLTAGLVATSALAAGHSLPIEKGEVFKKARAELLQAGWRPRKITVIGTDPANTAFHAAGYGETESCSSSDNFCVLDYVDAKGACLRLVVNYNRLTPLQAWTGEWTFDCPNPEYLKPVS